MLVVVAAVVMVIVLVDVVIVGIGLMGVAMPAVRRFRFGRCRVLGGIQNAILQLPCVVREGFTDTP